MPDDPLPSIALAGFPLDLKDGQLGRLEELTARLPSQFSPIAADHGPWVAVRGFVSHILLRYKAKDEAC